MTQARRPGLRRTSDELERARARRLLAETMYDLKLHRDDALYLIEQAQGRPA